MPGPIETNVGLSCIFSQPASHTSTYWDAAVIDESVSELRELMN